ncbi:MAG: hypothetical protein K2Q20_02950 [Phycisphaerales bacterium]|nr:hypothetical protein [Phycisphaerales bacterium]
MGSRRAMLDAAAGWRVSLLIGALLVLSAGLARNYDGEDLRHEPFWLLGPFVASIITSLLLFGLYKIIAAGKGLTLAWRRYPGFLGLYWLTAPLAWLYGVPYETFLSPVDAIHANAVTLCVVALWRVLLMARLGQVLLGGQFWTGVVVDLCFGISVITLASIFGPRPVLDVMGGLRLSAVERAQSELAMLTTMLGLLAALVLLPAALIAARRMRLPGLNAEGGIAGVDGPSPTPRGRPWGVAAIAVLSVLAWLPALAVEQPKQRVARRVDGLVEAGDFGAAVALLSGLRRSELPASWHAPVGPPGQARDVLIDGMREAFNDADPASTAWVRRMYVDRTGERLWCKGYVSSSGSWAEGLERATWWFDGPFEPRTLSEVRRLGWMAAQRDVLTDRELAAIRHALDAWVRFAERPEPSR